ncbi:PH domain-containing protein [Photobacterium sp. 1_MG-2023]|uniref:PH domain-containing protein n=1 Tax=Photobacterium sp. 1_MG-2023 TaxID=3062646 RepID=UPI0026E3613B|nr:PH domain-containing protein [Photobacterium sp. 1_MG-2023]MDO6704933.1 PH domain-containing protein [Photobacterium sp. 1_MG-2023]
MTYPIDANISTIFILSVIFIGGAILSLTPGLNWITISVAILILAFYAISMLQILTSKVEIQDNQLYVGGKIWKYQTLLENIGSIESQENYNSNISIRYRANGISLFGYNVGSFRSKNGEKVFMMTNKKPYAVVSLKEGKYKYIIISADAENLKRLKSLSF